MLQNFVKFHRVLTVIQLFEIWAECQNSVVDKVIDSGD